MSKQLLSDLNELIDAGLISMETAEAIESYYAKKRESSPNRILLAFAILGALLTGLGIILIVAHNWDTYSQLTKTLFAFAPLLLGQVVAAYSILRRADSLVWREASVIFLILSLGACISLVSQIYHLLGDLSSFLFWWTILSLPLMYLMPSSMASLLVWSGATYYGVEAGYFERGNVASPWYWLMVLTSLPYYYQLSHRSAASNFSNFHHFIIPMSVVIVFGTESHSHPQIMYLAYMILFGLLHLVGTWIKETHPVSNISGYQLAGKLAPLGLLIWFSFYGTWNELRFHVTPSHWMHGQEFHLFLVLMALYLGLSFWLYTRRKVPVFSSAFNVLPLVFMLSFFTAMYNPFLSTVAVNLLLLGLGIATVIEGSRKNSITTLNIGMLTLMALLICRFFDLKIDYITRGLLFIVAGICFFMGNYWMIKKQKV